MTSDIITTHFDYHSIDSNLLKLDILGHDDPTMIRMLEDLTGINAREIPLTAKKLCPYLKVRMHLALHRKISEVVRLAVLESRSLEPTLRCRC